MWNYGYKIKSFVKLCLYRKLKFKDVDFNF